eukprot:954007_1
MARGRDPARTSKMKKDFVIVNIPDVNTIPKDGLRSKGDAVSNWSIFACCLTVFGGIALVATFTMIPLTCGPLLPPTNSTQVTMIPNTFIVGAITTFRCKDGTAISGGKFEQSSDCKATGWRSASWIGRDAACVELKCDGKAPPLNALSVPTKPSIGKSQRFECKHDHALG